MLGISKHDEISDPQGHVTGYTTRVEGNDMKKLDIESLLVKKFGEMPMKKGSNLVFSFTRKFD